MSLLHNIFQESMKREHKTVTTYTTGEQFDCFFRKNNDNLNIRDTMVMYYETDAPVKIGTLLSYGDNIYLTLTQETAENEIYYKSSIIKTNGIINTHDLSVMDLPFYGDGVNNSNTSGNNNLTIIDGRLEVLTEDNAASRTLTIDAMFNSWGRTWRIENLFYVDGICHVILNVNPDVTPVYNYRLELSALDYVNVEPGYNTSIKALAYINDNEVTNATIIYTSSDENVATISADGNISYISCGEVYFSATWQEQNITENTSTVTVLIAPVDDSIDIYVESLEEIFYDCPETLRYYVTKGGVRDDTIPVLFKIENLSGVSSNAYNTYLKKIKVTDNGDHTITLEVSGSSMYQKSFDLVAYNEEYDVENRQHIKVTTIF